MDLHDHETIKRTHLSPERRIRFSKKPMQPNTTSYHQARLLVVGDIILDRYWSGPTNRVSPEAPVPVVRINEVEERPGGAGNVALNVASLGAQCVLMGVTGDDESANLLEQELAKSGVTCCFMKAEHYPTITKLRVLSQHQQLIRLDFESSQMDADLAPMHTAFKEQLTQTDLVILSDYAKGCLQSVSELIDLCREAGKPVVVDPKGSDFSKYRGATLITPNYGEFTAIVGTCKDDEEIVSKALHLCQSLELKAILVTRGEHGMTLVDQQGHALHLPAQAAEVFDVTGAGDTVIATLATVLAAGGDLSQATALANTAAGLVVAKLGAASITSQELHRAHHTAGQKGQLPDHLRSDESGVMTESRLHALVDEARLRGERIVMTNGCFDILHPGHVSYLQEARKLGDRLIVAVNDDASVQRLKGETRPINTLSDRMTILAALASVDWVVPFSEDTPARLIGEVLPEILVKGGDYTVEQIAGAEAVIKNGGEVIILNFVDGYSTTKLIAQAKDAG